MFKDSICEAYRMPEDSSWSTKIGDRSEKCIMNVLKTFPDVSNVLKDLNNSKYDIFFIYQRNLRGLQVKTLGRRDHKTGTYGINHLDSYENGTLIVCVDPKKYGLVFIMSPKYQKGEATVTLGGKKSLFSPILLKWVDFLMEFQKYPKDAHVINSIDNYMTNGQRLSMELTKRFLTFCKHHNLSALPIQDFSSVTDILVEGKNIQLKYASKPQNTKRTYSYKIYLERNGKTPYKHRDNDYYIIELGGYHSEKLTLSEDFLIERGYISTENQNRKRNLNVHPRSYVQDRKKETRSNHLWRNKGNWTTDSDLWYDKSRNPNFTTDVPQPYNKIGDGPEGVEIRIFANRLNFSCKGCKMQSIKIVRGPYKENEKKRYVQFREQVETFEPHRVTKVKSKGKWLYFKLNGPSYAALGVHHGMEGSWCTNPDNKHIILEIEISAEHKTSKKIYFQDSRRFGTFLLLTQDQLNKELDKIGPDIFRMTFEEFDKSLETKRIQQHRLCEVLMDQKIISGIGNYLRADIMYLAKIDPKTEIRDLSDKNKERLYKAIRKVSRTSYKAGSTTVGYYESAIHSGNYKPLVYQKTICPKGKNVENFKDKNGRTVYYVSLKSS